MNGEHVEKTRYATGLTKLWMAKLALATVLALASPLAAAAGTILATSPSGQPWVQNAEGVLGYKFDVLDEAFLVTSLGFYDTFGNGLARSHDIGLWAESGGAPLASATVPAGTGGTLEAEFRWVDLTTPLLLSANTSYFLAATYVMNDFVDIARGDAVINPLFSVVNAGYYADGSGLLFPANHFAGVQGFFGPNLSGTTVPDRASSAWLMAIGVLALALRAHLQS
jgi:Domain of unknown function (DUF4082)